MQSFISESGNAEKPAREGQQITVGAVEELPPGRSATVRMPNGEELALYNIGGAFYAIENFCPHKGAPLAEGRVCGHVVECEWHGWQFDLRTGECVTHRSAVETYQVTIEDGLIKIEI